MLQSLTLQNFKPIRGPIALDFGEVTLLAGLNSSGKSSVLQAILMLSQTFGHSDYERSLVPNGNQVQLGLLAQVKNENAKPEDPVSIGFRLSFHETPRYRRHLNGNRSRITEITVNASFQPTEVDTGILRSEGGATLTSLNMNIKTVYRRSLQLHAEPMSTGESELYTENVSGLDKQRWRFGQGISYKTRITQLGPIWEDPTTQAEESIQGVARMRHFMPERIVVRQKMNFDGRMRYVANALVRMAFNYSMSSLYMSDAESNVFPLPEEMITGFYEYVLKNEQFGRNRRVQSLKRKDGSFAGFISWLREAMSITGLHGREKENFRNNLLRKITRDGEKWAESSNVYELSTLQTIEGELLEEAVKAATNFFFGKIRYLGPLRVDPQAMQSFSPSSELDDVGSRGQYAAAVYDANRLKLIRWWNPDKNAEDFSTLEHALNVWIQHLSVAYRVHTSEARETGVAWRVLHRPGAKDRPLSAVGVGVSQVVPILVAGLLAPVDSLLLLEQPELHLHMRAQARLGDFFVGLARTGKRCLIETHSDCLVNQMRLYIAQSNDEDTTPSVRVLFAQQDEADGRTTFSPVEISESGNILNWPDGFFDQTIRQEEAITKASLRKRMNRRR
ncbi:DUF3696 domain-containing protein [Nannocystis pusilla]|uniref:DUF3696 domain-containing protein n=1 Tax=Nannocystis pusilla TaxID=889268 RepID=A0ABS7TU90_9BACT|nr:DUF3696 domain-containing protein [Nannocystis pusilla]MBZ5711731.1 DUF3696 domain-containing protein [Nannocystis pusilla]